MKENPTYKSAQGFNEGNPLKAFKDGMKARLTNEQEAATFSIKRHLEGGERNISPYISTTEDIKTAREFALGTGNAPQSYGFETRNGKRVAVARGIVYTIKPTQGNMRYAEDLAKSEGVAEEPSVKSKLTQKEWVAFRKIDPQNISASQVFERVAEVDSSGKPGPWSEATPVKGNITIDSNSTISGTLANDYYKADHPGFIPKSMPKPSGTVEPSKPTDEAAVSAAAKNLCQGGGSALQAKAENWCSGIDWEQVREKAKATVKEVQGDAEHVKSLPQRTPEGLSKDAVHEVATKTHSRVGKVGAGL
ncbi:hypothetical protein ACWC2C_32970, partial [Streptomyces klenkii]